MWARHIACQLLHPNRQWKSIYLGRGGWTLIYPFWQFTLLFYYLHFLGGDSKTIIHKFMTAFLSIAIVFRCVPIILLYCTRPYMYICTKWQLHSIVRIEVRFVILSSQTECIHKNQKSVGSVYLSPYSLGRLEITDVNLWYLQNNLSS